MPSGSSCLDSNGLTSVTIQTTAPSTPPAASTASCAGGALHAVDRGRLGSPTSAGPYGDQHRGLPPNHAHTPDSISRRLQGAGLGTRHSSTSSSNLLTGTVLNTPARGMLCISYPCSLTFMTTQLGSSPFLRKTNLGSGW